MIFDRYFVTPVIALGLAFLIWVYLRSRDQEVQVYSIPVEISIDGLQMDRYDFESRPDVKLRVKFYGLPKGLRAVKDMVDLDELVLRKVARVPVEVDQRSDNEYQDVLQLDASSLQASLPLGVHAEINPADGRVPVVLKRMVEKTLVLQPNLTPAGGQYMLDGPVRLEPSSVKVRGPKSVLDQVSQHLIDPWQPTPPAGVDLLAEGSVEVSGKVRVPTTINRVGVTVSPETVEVRVKVKAALQVYELTDVPVYFLCPADFPYRPQFPSESHNTCKLRVRGPANKTPEVRAYVDLPALAGQQALRHGTYPDAVISVDLPNGYYLVGEAPKLSAFKLVQLDMTPGKTGAGGTP